MNNDFFIEKQKAVERMKQMQRRSQQNGGSDMPPMPYFVSANRHGGDKASADSQNRQDSSEKTGSLFSSLGLPFTSLKNDPDISLILGILLLLSSEKADKLLLYALIYILM